MISYSPSHILTPSQYFAHFSFKILTGTVVSMGKWVTELDLVVIFHSADCVQRNPDWVSAYVVYS